MVFVYLSVIAFTLVVSVWDNACAGPGCESAPAIRVLLTVLYSACLLSLGATTTLFVDHAVRGNRQSFARTPAALKSCGAAVGVTLFFLMSLISLVAAGVLSLTAIVTWRVLYRFGERGQQRSAGAEVEIPRRLGPPPSDPNLN